MNNPFSITLVVALMLPFPSAGEPADGQHLEYGNTCVMTHEPRSCMESYGFRCHQGRLPSKSIEAHSIGCNLDLGDGRHHFVQMLFDDGGWNVELQKTSTPEVELHRQPEEDRALALSGYIERRMSDYSVHSSGSGTNAHDLIQVTFSGTRRIDDHVVIAAACGAIVDANYGDNVTAQLKSDCERVLARTVKLLSQSNPTGTYRVPASTDFAWSTDYVRIVSGDNAMIAEGQYKFPDVHTPCRWKSDCCSSDGSIYLSSCRVPSESERQAIQSCLSESIALRSGEFQECLRAAGVKIGCERQSDGSQICH